MSNFLSLARHILLILCVLGCSIIKAEEGGPTGSIKGVIRTRDGRPAAFVSLQLKNTKYGTFTDENGGFALRKVAKGDYVLIVSHTGLKTMEKKISVTQGQTAEVLIDLQEDSKQMDAVVVNGIRSANLQKMEIGKMSISPRDYPQSMVAISGTVIADQQGNKLSDVLKNVNGIALGTTRGTVTENFYARGYSLGANNIFKNGSRTNAASLPEASTLESVEVLKGSAALLYGGVSGGAVVNMITKQPKFNYGGEVSFRTGSNSFYKPIVDVYGPLSRHLAFRVVGTYENAKSFRDVVSSERIYVNPSLLYKFSDKTTLEYSMDYLKTDFTPDFGIGTIDSKLRPDVISRNTFLNTPWAYNKVDQVTNSLNFNHRFNDRWRLNINSSYQDYKRNYFGTERIQFDANGGWKRNLTRTRTDEQYYATQVNINGDFKTAGIEHKFLAGVDGDITRTVSTTFIFKPVYDSINIFNPSTIKNARLDIPDTRDSLYTASPVRRFGAYVQDLISITRNLKLLAGIRWSYQETPQTSIRNVVKDSVYGGAAAYKDDKAFSPRVGLVYQPLKSTSFFVSYSNNFTPNTGTDVYLQALKPSIIDQFEIGMKNDFFDGRLSANVTVYRVINNDLAQMAEFEADGVTPNSNTNIKQFTGQTTSDGFEIDLNGALSKNIYFLAGYSNNYMRYTKTSGADNSFVTGEKLVNNTAQTANGTVFYTFSGTALRGIKVGMSAFYTGKRIGGWNNTRQNIKDGLNRNIPVGDFTTLDVSAGYSFKKFSVLAKLSNITNVYNYYVHENYSVNPIAPRQISATVSYKF